MSAQDSAENDAGLHERIVRAHERERARTSRTVDWRSFDAGYRAALSDTRVLPPADRCVCPSAEVDNGTCVLCGKPFLVGGGV